MAGLEFIAADDGWPLAVRHWPSVQRRGSVLIVHNLRERIEDHATTCARLAEASFDVYAFDLRGHGQSAKPDDPGLVEPHPAWPTLIAEVDRVRRYALETTGSGPVFLLGIGTSADIVQSVAQAHGNQYAGIVLVGPDDIGAVRCRVMQWIVRIERWRRGPTAQAGWFHDWEARVYKRRAGGRWRDDLQSIWRSASRPASDAADTDTNTDADAKHKTVLRLRTFASVLAGRTGVRRRTNRLRMPRTLPILILAGRDDPAGRHGQMPAKLARALVNDGFRDVSRYCYAGARDNLLAGHFGGDALDDLTVWIERRLALH